MQLLRTHVKAFAATERRNNPRLTSKSISTGNSGPNHTSGIREGREKKSSRRGAEIYKIAAGDKSFKWGIWISIFHASVLWEDASRLEIIFSWEHHCGETFPNKALKVSLYTRGVFLTKKWKRNNNKNNTVRQSCTSHESAKSEAGSLVWYWDFSSESLSGLSADTVTQQISI